MVCRKRRSSSTTSTVPLALIVPCPPQRALRPHLSLPSSTSRLDTYPVRAGTGPGSGLVTASPGVRPLQHLGHAGRRDAKLLGQSRADDGIAFHGDVVDRLQVITCYRT